MTPPEIPPLPEDVRALFDEERMHVALSPDARARLSARLSRAVARAPWPRRALRAARGGSWLAVAFVAGAGAHAFFDSQRHAPARSAVSASLSAAVQTPAPMHAARENYPPPSSSAPQNAVEEHSTPPVEIATRETVPRSPSAPPPPHAPRASASSAPSVLAAERAQIEIARAAMTRGRWDEASAALERHARSSPDGQLAEERESMRVVLLSQEAHTSEARRALERFERAYPASLFLPVVRAAVDSVTDSPDGGQGP